MVGDNVKKTDEALSIGHEASITVLRSAVFGKVGRYGMYFTSFLEAQGDGVRQALHLV